MDAGLAVPPRALDEAAAVLDRETLAALRAPAAPGVPPAVVLERRPYGSLVAFASLVGTGGPEMARLINKGATKGPLDPPRSPVPGEPRARLGTRGAPRISDSLRVPAPARRRVLEVDRGGTLATVLRWQDGALAEASVRIPDGRWVTIEPRATRTACGPCDRLWLGAGPRRGGADALVTFAAVEYAAVGAIPALADPSRLPHGAGTAVLNLLASLAADQGRGALRYEGPYPTEQLFLALLESFRYVAAADEPDPLAAFLRGDLAWDPAPHERSVERGGLVVQLRDRVEKVTWDGRTYYRPDWQAVARHAPRRVRDASDVLCSLWALGVSVEDHLRLTGDGHLTVIVAPAPLSGTRRPLPDAIARGVVAIAAATCVPALAPFVRASAEGLAIAWAPVDRDLLRVRGSHVDVSARVRGVAVRQLGEAPDRAARVSLAFALLAEIAALAGDTLRARAQAALAACPEAEQQAALAVEEDPERQTAAGVIARAVAALLADLTAD